MDTLKKVKQLVKDRSNVQKRTLLISILVFSYWLKAVISYFFSFSLGIEGGFQILLALMNPIGITLLLYTLPLFFSKGKRFVHTLLFVNFLNTFWLFANVLYFKEFSDFLTADTLVRVSAISGGLGHSTLKMMSFSDLFYWLDTVILAGYLGFHSKSFDVTVAKKPTQKLVLLSTLMVIGNICLANIDRPQLLTRSFDNKYLVKYLGLVPYLAHNGVNSYEVSQVKANAAETSLAPVLDYLATRKTTPNESTFGIAKDRDVVYIHLESIQQFLIDYKLNVDGVEYEVTPTLNALFHSQDSLAFDNVFHQTSAGKTADAEFLIENSLFGVDSGAAMVKYGNNTFYSAPTIFKTKGYTSAVFHGNTSTFWNRNKAYKSFGYDKFYSLDFYNYTEDQVKGYGLLDDVFFNQSYNFYSELSKDALTYTKYIPVSNHFPYEEIEGNPFPLATTNDETVNGYFATANYFDTQLAAFIEELKADGTYNNTIFVLYGDHYGVSNARNKSLAPLLEEETNSLFNTDLVSEQTLEDSVTTESVPNENGEVIENVELIDPIEAIEPLDVWDAYDNLNLQRVPLIFHIPGANLNTTEINHTYGGQIDILPTLLNLMGDNTPYVQVGQDLLSINHQDFVVLRNGTIITDKYTIVNLSKIYIDGIKVEYETLPLLQQEEINNLIKGGQDQLDMSDAVVTGDLLRFYSTTLPKVNVNDYDYTVPVEEHIPESESNSETISE